MNQLRMFKHLFKSTQRRLLCSVPKKQEQLECTIRYMLDDERKVVQELRSLIIPDSSDYSSDKFFENYNLWDIESTIVAVNQTKVYGTVELLMPLPDPNEIHDGKVPDEWKGTGLYKDAYITNLSVDPEVRRQSVGTQLLKFALDRATNANMDRVFVHCEPWNSAVRTLNEKMGYVA
ncbi:uncharacterized protein [Rutidosis leptorrhynchoides]|uniref:uncharacterized protein n=1 Tax=Rutidosis leptorrhynchoides TaxID=125765 RepID=UPI003A9A2B0C